MTGSMRTLDELPKHPAPAIDLATHRLRVEGRVQAPRDYSAADLAMLATGSHTEDFDCLEGWVVPDQQWEGVPLALLIEQAEPLADASLVTIGYEDFDIVIPLEIARQSLLALSLNGAPLTLEHGGPVRLLVPGGECYTSVKWVDRIVLHAEAGAPSGRAREVAMRRIGLDPDTDPR
ncbi:MAG: molybdopterin-dependent oxidoreductase [Dehalococcoidia bacterium]